MISSRNNPEIIEAAKLRKKKRRDETGLFLIDGTKLVFEALQSGIRVKRLFATEDWIGRNADRLPLGAPEPLAVGESVMQKISAFKSPEGVVGVARMSGPAPSMGPAVFLDDIQDPGNLGTIIRTADAAGFGSVVCSRGCADIYNEKTLRAAMGSLFHISVTRSEDLAAEARVAKAAGRLVVGADLKGEELRFGDENVPRNFILILGNESNGVSGELLAECDRLVRIHSRGAEESLNVAVAAGILMYAFTT